MPNFNIIESISENVKSTEREKENIYAQENIASLHMRNFMKKPFTELSEEEKTELKQNLYDQIYNQCNDKMIKFKIEEIFEIVLTIPELISVNEFLHFMNWTTDIHSTEYYICMETMYEPLNNFNFVEEFNDTITITI